MSTINTNISSLIAQTNLAKNNATLSTSLQRLSTGLKINSGADDPAGLIAAENLKSQQAGLNTALSNATRAGNVIGTAEGGLNEVSSLLTELQNLVGQSANTGGLSPEEVAANQLQVDSILSTVNRISNSTTFQGTQLLNGNLSYTTSGVTASALSSVSVNAANIPDGSKVNVLVNVTQSAQTGAITYTGTIGAGGATISIGGNTGTTQLSFASGTTVSGIKNAINAVKQSTGLSAQVSGAYVRINSTGYGSTAFVSVSAISGTFAPSASQAYGRDAIVTVNGAAATVSGTNVSYRSNDLDVSFNLGTAANKTNGASNFYITGGGATFQLGANVDASSTASIGIGSVSTGALGSQDVGFLSSLGTGGANSLSSGNLSTAQIILSTAVTQVSTLRGRLGAFQDYTLNSTSSSLNVALENSTSALSSIEDANFASETANLTRSQILVQAATTVLSTANSAPQNILKLLG
jgi:flagellin